MSEPSAVLRIGAEEIELPMVVGTEDERGIDISKLRAQTGLDHPRLRLREHRRRASRRSPSSTATPGILRYRGIADRGARRAATHPSFLETVVPAHLRRAARPRTQLDEFRFGIRKHTLLHEDVKRFFDGFPKDAHPMATLVVGGQRAVDLLPGQRRPARPRAGAALDHPAHGEAARRSRRTRTRSRSASRSSTPTTRSTSSRTSSR